MESPGVYSLKQERLSAERQQSGIRLFLALTSALVLIKYYMDELSSGGEDVMRLTLEQVVTASSVLLTYSVAMWVLVRYKSDKLKIIVAVSSVVEVVIITYVMRSTAGTDIPFHLWYVFYVVNVATRYGSQYSVLALSASIVTFTSVAIFAPQSRGYGTNVTAVLGFTGFLLVLAFMFGRISEKQLNYQASLAVVNEFRGELAGLTTSKEIIGHLLSRTKALLNSEKAFFLPAKRGSDGSEDIGLRSAGADPVLLSTFREGGGAWNVQSMLQLQHPLMSNAIAKDPAFSDNAATRLGLRNLAASPMMVRNVPVGVVYAANRKDKALSTSDLQLLELVATQAAPVVENALLWERLREAAASEERLRIARDLHDNFLQTLAAIKLHLERCKILVTKDTDRALAGIDKIHQISTRGLAEVRVYLSELRLMGPEPSRFRQAIERCSEDAATKGEFETDIEIDLPDEPMPPNVALAAFQILRELLNNAAAHSDAKHVRVCVCLAEGMLSIGVEDDGKGFNVSCVRAEKASQGHLGLVGVEERAKQSDGVFCLISEPGKGTKASATLSLSP